MLSTDETILFSGLLSQLEGIDRVLSAEETIHFPTYVPGLNNGFFLITVLRVQELCERRGGRPGLPVLLSLTGSVDAKQH